MIQPTNCNQQEACRPSYVGDGNAGVLPVWGYGACSTRGKRIVANRECRRNGHRQQQSIQQGTSAVPLHLVCANCLQSPTPVTTLQSQQPTTADLRQRRRVRAYAADVSGASWPFTYDPVYGLPVVNDVATYSAVLRGIREGQVAELLWFQAPDLASRTLLEGRCLVRYHNGRVQQSAVPRVDSRVVEAMRAAGVKASLIPLEPRQGGGRVGQHSAVLDNQGQWPAVGDVFDDDAPYSHPFARWYQRHVAFPQQAPVSRRRGPQVAPTVSQLYLLPGEEKDRAARLQAQMDATQAELDVAQRMDTEEWDEYLAGGKPAFRGETQPGEEPQAQVAKRSWTNNIQISQETQALIIRWVPILGPLLGSAFIIGLYMLSRLVKGDLTDRMNMMNQEDEKRKKSQLKEVRTAFLEEELPALVAKGITLEEAQKRTAAINKRLGAKLQIGEQELASTWEACQLLLKEGADLSGGSTSASAASKLLAEEDARQEAAVRQSGAEGGGDGQGGGNDMDALMEMGKLNTARIRKATDPKIMEVKKRVRQARRALKRESKVQLSDEVIFFDDVAGNAEAKVQLAEVVDFFNQPQKFKASGARAPKGVLLVGSPGNGKTLMARAVAGESGVAFISSSASEFIEMYMGLGAARVRDVFQTARKLAPCIIFIDELDAVGRARRGGGGGGGNDERDNTVNQLLAELDGFEAEQQGIVVMAATNRKDVLDSALTRPGRFDRSIEVRRPDFQGRLEAVKVHLRDKPIAPDIDYRELASLSGGMSGAQVAGMCNAGAFLASREGRTEVRMEDLRRAADMSKYGVRPEVNSFLSPARRQRLALVEAGICLVASLLPAIEPVDYVTALPSARSPVGRTVLKPNVGRYTTGVWTKRYLREQLLLALAGRAAEELVMGRDELSSLHQYRLMLARQIAHKLLNAGMSDHPDFANLRALGDQHLDPSFEPGRYQVTTVQTDYNQTRSEWVDVDMEMHALLNDSYSAVKNMVERNRACLDRLAELLNERTRVEGDEIRAVVEQLGCKEDLVVREEAKQFAFL
ncbi:hypothetical protein QJQ45_025987 [Haematococcus lacustris]|nr:hypothetical protein QJQ45_025987 [Haematococcus lacustris]